MKKIICLFVFAVMAAGIVSAQTVTIPTSTETISWKLFASIAKGDTAIADLDTTQAQEALKFATAGPYASVVNWGKGTEVTTVWDITNVPSRGGITETQQLYFYTDADDESHVALVRKGATVVLKDGSIKVHRGDDDSKKYW